MIKPEKFYEALRLSIIWSLIFIGIAVSGRVTVWLNVLLLLFSFSLFVIPYKSDGMIRKVGALVLPFTIAYTVVHIGVALLRMIGLGTGIVVCLMPLLAILWNLAMTVDSKVKTKLE